MAKKTKTKKDAKRLAGAFFPTLAKLGDAQTWSMSIDKAGKSKVTKGIRASKDKIEICSLRVAFILQECSDKKDVAKVIRLAKRLLAALEG